jgi:hypothetical protein
MISPTITIVRSDDLATRYRVEGGVAAFEK